MQEKDKPGSNPRDILSTIGNTPLVEIDRMSPKKGVKIFAKLEGQNPTGSLKDRIAKYMIEKAEGGGVRIITLAGHSPIPPRPSTNTSEHVFMTTCGSGIHGANKVKD